MDTTTPIRLPLLVKIERLMKNLFFSHCFLPIASEATTPSNSPLSKHKDAMTFEHSNGEGEETITLIHLDTFPTQA